MALRSGLTLWQLLGPAAQPLGTRLLRDERCDVAVLGSGVTGALVALALVKAGVDTVLLDKRELGDGSTAASTGLLQYEIDTPLVELVDKVGVDNAVRAYRRGVLAIDEIERLTHELGEPCGFSRRESLYFGSHWWHRWRLQREYECRRAHGFDVAWLDRARLAELSSIPSRAAILSRGDAQINPYQFTRSVLRAAQARGLRAYAHTEINQIDEGASEVRLLSSDGLVRCRTIVYATGYESYRYLNQDPGSLHCTYAVASEPLTSVAGWPGGALVWETARPYFYARQADDGRAIIGGEDTVFSGSPSSDEVIQDKAERLQRRFGKLFPEIAFRPACAWSGTFGESEDGLAYIGQPPERPRAYFAIGYGGNGITFSMISAALITDLFLGRPNADAAVFRFGR